VRPDDESLMDRERPTARLAVGRTISAPITWIATVLDLAIV